MTWKSFKKKLALLALLSGLASPSVVAGQTICPDPDKPCGSFKPYELPFRIPRSNLARAEDRSVDFYAIILKTSPPCSIPETERLTAQRLFPRHKVFLSRFECDPEDNLSYTSFDNSKYGVLGVYGGTTRREADRLLARVRKTGRFASAYIRRMTVILVHP